MRGIQMKKLTSDYGSGLLRNHEF